MKCWVSKQGKKGRVEFIFEGIFWKTFKNKDFGFKMFEKGPILMPFLGLAPSKLKIKKKEQAMCIKKNRLVPFSIWVMGRENRLFTKGLRSLHCIVKEKKIGRNYTGCL